MALDPEVLTKEAAILPRDEGVIAAWWNYKPKSGDLLSTNGKTLFITAEGARIPVAVWSSRYKYTFTPITGFRLADMVQEAVREWESYNPMVRPRITSSPLTMMEGRLAMDKKAFGVLTPRDEQVIRRWWDRKPAQGDFLFSDGETLSGMWDDVPSPLAVWQGWGTYKMVQTLNLKRKRIQEEIRKLAPGMDDPEWEDSLRLAGGSSGDPSFDAWEESHGLVRPAVSRGALLRISRVFRRVPAAMGIFRLYDRLYATAQGGPVPEGGFAAGFKAEFRVLLRALRRIQPVDSDVDLAAILMKMASGVMSGLKKIDRGSGSPVVYHQVSEILANGLVEILAVFGQPAVSYNLPGPGRFVGLKTVSGETLPSVPDEVRQVFSPEEEALPKSAAQQTANLDEMYAQAREASEYQLDLLNRGRGLDAAIGASVARGDQGVFADLDTPGPIVMIGPLKKRERVLEKSMAEGTDPSSVLDLVRATVAVDTPGEIAEVMRKLRDMGIKFARRPKNRFNTPTDVGYRDLMFNVVYPNGHIGEIQVNLKSMMKAKDMGHKYYEATRSIAAQKQLEGSRDLTPEEQRVVDDANRIQRDLYNEAWNQAMGAMGGGRMASLRVSGVARYYEYENLPASVTRGELPVMINRMGEDVTIYDIEKFYREAIPLTLPAYQLLLRNLFSKSLKNGSVAGVPDRLPEEPWRYFNRVPGAILVPVSSLLPLRDRPNGIEHAKELMWLSYNGVGPKRDPITLGDNGDGTFTVLDGNSTYANVLANKWRLILGVVSDSPTTRNDHMASLRSKVIRLASANPELRSVLLPLLTEGGKTAAKAPKPAPKLKGKKLDDAISAAYYRHGKGVQINIMDITKIYDAGKKAYEAAATVEEADKALDEAMQAAISQFRKN